MEMDFREPPASNLLNEYAARLGRSIVGPPSYGWSGKSVGALTDGGTWLRLTHRDFDRVNERTWTGDETAAVIPVSKPSLLRSLQWSEGTSAVWKLDEFTLIPGQVLSRSPDILDLPAVDSNWWLELKRDLQVLAARTTVRVAVRQDLVTRRIHEISQGAVDPLVEEWATAHGDLHWGNLAGPRLAILDWEGWGLAPRGLDIATLWAFSCRNESLREEIESQFEHELGLRSTQLSQLFICAELIRMSANYGDHPELADVLNDHSSRLVSILRR